MPPTTVIVVPMEVGEDFEDASVSMVSVNLKSRPIDNPREVRYVRVTQVV